MSLSSSSSSSSSSFSSCSRIILGVMSTVLVLLLSSSAAAFCSSPRSSCRRHDLLKSSTFVPAASNTRRRAPQKSSSSLNMFMGSDGGILGVGAPEVFTILLVGYFVLGPSDLYKVVKEIGKFVQSFRTLSTDLTKTVETNLESQLELEEVRKAQRELTDAFNFRRTINVNDESDPFSTKAGESSSVLVDEEPFTTETAAAPKKKKKRIRKRLKKRVVEETPPPAEQPMPAGTSGAVPDLDMTAAFEEEEPAVSVNDPLREERMERLMESNERERFAAQTDVDSWNAQIMANEDKLSPLSKVMERLAILEEEKNAANERLEEEFRLRAQLEEKYYKEKRDLLEQAAAEVQANAYVEMDNGKSQGKKESNDNSSSSSSSSSSTTVEA